MMAFTIKDFDQIVADMVAYIVANSSQITVLSPGSVIRSICEGAGLSLEELYVGTYLGFRRHLNDIPANIFDFTRKGGTKAAVNVVFTRAGSSGDVTIPAGTRVKTATDLRFILLANSLIADGNNDSAASAVEAESTGVAYNVSAVSINVIEDTVAGVDSVSNAAAATGGVDEETDFQYQTRFRAYIEGLGRANIAGLKAGALSVEGITSVSVLEHFPPVSAASISDGTCTTANGAGTLLIDSAATFITDGVQIGDTIINMTDGSIAYVSSIDSEIQITHSALIDGTQNDWDTTEIYKIYPVNINVHLYIDDGTAVSVSADQILEVQTAIDGDGTENNPGYRSAGVNVVVAAPSIVTQAVTLSANVLTGVSQNQVEVDITNAITNYINTLGVGEDIIYNGIVTAIMNVYGVTNVDVTVPSTDTTITSSQVGRIGAITIVIT